MPAAKESNSSANGQTGIVPSRLYFIDSAASLKTLNDLCSQAVNKEYYPLAVDFVSNIPIYEMSDFSSDNAKTTNRLQDEWNHILLTGPGVIVLRSFYDNIPLIDQVSKVFSSIIDTETSNTASEKGDHFAASGLNSRIWNSFQKHATVDPPSFTQYYSNPWLQLISESYLGPSYQITAQVNIVHPGGKPQVAHRDYHLGFQTAASCSRFPKSMQVASQLLTLQGAVAHTDMPLLSGPTRFVPFSQQFEPGYMSYRLPEFTAYFDAHWVSVPLQKGDAVFFNPALMHAAGQNDTSDIMRSANLLQISSAFGRTMEYINTIKVIGAVWDELALMYNQEGGFNQSIEALVAAIAEGYPFPTNLDRRPPAPGGMAPASEADFVREGLEAGIGKDEMMVRLKQLKDDNLG